MMKFGEMVNYLKAELQKAGIDSFAAESELILAHYLRLSKFDIYLCPKKVVSPDIEEKIIETLSRRCTHYPLQYLLGNVEFYNVTLNVNESVLIPRPETEILVEKIISENRQEHLNILDIGTGSGAIAIALKKECPTWQITATDISKTALNTAKENAQNNDCDVDFIVSDIWQNVQKKFDIIISNPPYINAEDYQNLAPELYFEPENALTANENGLYFYRNILEGCHNYLLPEGKLYFEIGHDQAESIKNIAHKNKMKLIEVTKDYNNFDRIITLKTK